MKTNVSNQKKRRIEEHISHRRRESLRVVHRKNVF